jgi:hypothetical protein
MTDRIVELASVPPVPEIRQILDNAIIVSIGADHREHLPLGFGTYQAAVAWTKVTFRLSLLFAPLSVTKGGPHFFCASTGDANCEEIV